jgi:membrane protein implicated in regulation of membrane protease activity
VQIWFWGWLLLAGILAVLEAFDREYYTLPWAFGAAAAALLEALHAPIGWEWVAFVGIGSALLVGVQRFRAPGRRSLKNIDGGPRRHR